MRSDVARDLDSSSSAFECLAWPVIAPMIGGGQFFSLEKLKAETTAHLLDTQVGLDGFQILGSGLICGVSCRMQPDTRAWDTFTIRYSRATGAETEFAKRMASILHPCPNLVQPRWIIHGYYDKQRDVLLSVAAIRTYDLMLYMNRYKNEDEKRVQKKTVAVDGNTFIVAGWQQLARDNVKVHQWHRAA